MLSLGRSGAVAVAAVVLFASAPAHARGSSSAEFGKNAPKNYSSSQWFALEIKFGPYSPDIDSSRGLTGTPFSDLYNRQGTTGRPKRMLLTSLELDVQFFRKYGQNLGVGASWGIMRRSTHSFEYVDAASQTGCVPAEGTCTRSGDTSTLTVMPLALLFVYRFDLLANRYHIPLVPYFKIGLAYGIWWIENGSGSTVAYTSGTQSWKGYGGTFGWVLQPGIAFQLDVIEPRVARTLDAEIGINHTYLFCELNYMDLSGFGAENKLTLSDTTLNAGLAFEF